MTTAQCCPSVLSSARRLLVALAGLCVSLREFSQCALRLVFSGTELYSLPHAVARLSANQALLCVCLPRYTVCTVVATPSLAVGRTAGRYTAASCLLQPVLAADQLGALRVPGFAPLRRLIERRGRCDAT